MVRSFLAATAQGYEYAAAHPEEAAAILLEEVANDVAATGKDLPEPLDKDMVIEAQVITVHTRRLQGTGYDNDRQDWLARAISPSNTIILADCLTATWASHWRGMHQAAPVSACLRTAHCSLPTEVHIAALPGCLQALGCDGPCTLGCVPGLVVIIWSVDDQGAVQGPGGQQHHVAGWAACRGCW